MDLVLGLAGMAGVVVVMYYGFTSVLLFLFLPLLGYGQIRRRGYSPSKATTLVFCVGVLAVLAPIGTAFLVRQAGGVWGILEMAILYVGLPIACMGLGCTVLVRKLPKREFRVSGRRRVGFPFVSLGYLVIASGIALVVATLMLAPPERRTVGNVLRLLLVGVICAGAGKALIATGNRVGNQPSIEESARLDARPPVLFLRPFVADQIPFVRGPSSKYGCYSTNTQKVFTALRSTSDADGNKREEDPIISIMFEVYFTRTFQDRIGPFVALGNPEDYLPPEGATRTYADDEGWYQYFERLARQAVCIVMPVSCSDNLQRELEFLRSEGLQQRLLVFTPLWMATDERLPFPTRASLWIVSRLYGISNPMAQLSNWSHLGGKLAKLGFELGADPGRGAVVTFDSGGKAMVLATGADTPSGFVEPVREHLIRTFGLVFGEDAAI